jgi:hypothetical protein
MEPGYCGTTLQNCCDGAHHTTHWMLVACLVLSYPSSLSCCCQEGAGHLMSQKLSCCCCCHLPSIPRCWCVLRVSVLVSVPGFTTHPLTGVATHASSSASDTPLSSLLLTLLLCISHAYGWLQQVGA